MGRQAAPNGECLVEANELFYPRIDEQVVADAYLAGAVKAVLIEQKVKIGRVEHYVAVVGDKEMTACLVHIAGETEGETVGATPYGELHYGLHEAYLEVLRGLDTLEATPQQAVKQALGQYGNKASHDKIELAVSEKLLKDYRYLVFVIRSYFVKLVNIHAVFG